MKSKIATINSDKLFQIVSDMNNINFNNQNPLINDLLNHVEIESSINREIPQVQNKLDLITSQQNQEDNSVNNYPNSVNNYPNSVNNYPNSVNNYPNSVNNYSNSEINYEQSEENDQCNNMNIAKLCIISLIIIAILCFIVYKYIDKYKYIIMCCIGAAVLASDYFIGKRLLYF